MTSALPRLRPPGPAPASRGAASGAVRFGPYRLDLETGELRCDEGTPVRLRPLVTRALCLLVRRRGRLVSRAELRRELWGEAILEWEPGLHQVIRQLRRALGDDAREPAYVETVPRRGYRFKARIEDDCSAGLEATRFSNDRPDEPRPSRSWGLLLFLGGVLSVPLVVVLLCVVLAV